MLHSDYRPLVSVDLPFQGRQMYMHTFDLANPVMAPGFEDYLEPVRALCHAAGAVVGEAHMTVDEKVIQPGRSQRRPKPHVDGVFVIASMNWGHGGGWNHGCNNIGAGPVRRMPVIVAASAIGCRVWRGTFNAIPAADGDLSHLSLPEGEIVPANMGFLLNGDCVHESLIQPVAAQRTFLRIALPVNFPF
jgi:hypothetical protein